MESIPTRYAGVQFRSRLEARWAAFFDLLGWRWAYEPLDLDGYIPDFVVEYNELPMPWGCTGGPAGWLVGPGRVGDGPADTRRLVEVKPEMSPLDLLGATIKIDASGWTGEASVVGAQLWPRASGVEIGTMRYRADSERWGWGEWFMRGRSSTLSAWNEAANRVQWRAPNLETL